MKQNKHFVVFTLIVSLLLLSPMMVSAENAFDRVASRAAEKKIIPLPDKKIEVLNQLMEKISRSETLPQAEKTALLNAIQSQISTANSPISSQSGNPTKDIRPKAGLIAAAEALGKATLRMEEAAKKLEIQITAAAGAGKDVTIMKSNLEEMKIKIAEAKSAAQKIKETIIALTDDKETNKTQLQSAIQTLKSGHMSIKTARDLAHRIIFQLTGKRIKPVEASKSAMPVFIPPVTATLSASNSGFLIPPFLASNSAVQGIAKVPNFFQWLRSLIKF